MESAKDLHQPLQLWNAAWSLSIQHALILPMQSCCKLGAFALAHAEKVVDVFTFSITFKYPDPGIPGIHILWGLLVNCSRDCRDIQLEHWRDEHSIKLNQLWHSFMNDIFRAAVETTRDPAHSQANVSNITLNICIICVNICLIYV